MEKESVRGQREISERSTWGKKVGILLCILSVFAACNGDEEVSDVAGEDAGVSSPQTSAFSVFAREGPCPVPVPAGLMKRVVCGEAHLPEDRAQQETEYVKLPYMILSPALPAVFPDPIVYLAGGPGDPVFVGDDPFDDWAVLADETEREIVLFAQRGTYLADPALVCEEHSSLSAAATIIELVAAQRLCHARFLEEDRPLHVYNTQNSAADVADLRRVLGYESWNLFGISYGTRLALTVLRDYPEGVRSAVLDSVFPPEVDSLAEDAVHFAAAIDRLGAQCRAHRDCQRVYPDFAGGLRVVVERYEQTPRIVVDPDESGENWQVTVDGNLVVRLLVEILGEGKEAGRLPAFVKLVEQSGAQEGAEILAKLAFDFSLLEGPSGQTPDGFSQGSRVRRALPGRGNAGVRSAFRTGPPFDLWDLSRDFSFGLPSGLSTNFFARGLPAHSKKSEEDTPATTDDIDAVGMYNSVMCNEEAVFTAGVPVSDDILVEVAARSAHEQLAVCAFWRSGRADPVENLPVVSDIPTLLLSGEFDVWTPSLWARAAVKHLSRGQFIVFPGEGHAFGLDNVCARSIFVAFLGDPAQVLPACVTAVSPFQALEAGEP